MPKLRTIAKRIAKNSPLDFIQMDKRNVYEMILLEGLVPSYMNESFKKLLPLTEKILRKVDNWAQIDSTIIKFKSIDNSNPEVL